MKLPKKKTVKKSVLEYKLDRIFSIYIRLRDSDEDGYSTCISCGKRWHITDRTKNGRATKIQCGHYENRGNIVLRFNEINCNAQCCHCNKYREGSRIGYNEGIIKKWGKEKVEMLGMKSRHRHYKKHEYEYMIKDYVLKAFHLAKTKTCCVTCLYFHETCNKYLGEKYTSEILKLEER